MKSKPLKIIYTILADDLPVAALEASGVEARELLKEDWLIRDLSTLTVDGEAICGPVTRLRVRPATEAEWTIYEKESRTADDADELLLVYLVNLDSD